MLKETEARIADLETGLAAQPKKRPLILPEVVEAYLDDLKGLIGKDNDRARSILAKLRARSSSEEIGIT